MSTPTVKDIARTDLLSIIARRLRPAAPKPTGRRPRLKVLPGIKAVLFDVYGTLLTTPRGEIRPTGELDRRKNIRAALRAADFILRRKSAAVVAADLLPQFIAESQNRRRREGIAFPEVEIRDVWGKIVARLKREGSIGGRMDVESIEALAVEYECRANPLWPMPGASATLERLHRAGLILGLVSNAQFYTPIQLAFFRQTGALPDVFDPGISIFSFQFREAKPSSRLIKEALSRLRRRYRISPPATLMVGNDLLNDIRPAARLGCKTTLFAGDRSSLRLRTGDLRVRGVAPDLIITSLPQLLKAIRPN